MFTSKTTATPKYIKSKAYGLIGTIALFTSLAFLMGPGVSAEEVTTPVSTPTVVKYPQKWQCENLSLYTNDSNTVVKYPQKWC